MVMRIPVTWTAIRNAVWSTVLSFALCAFAWRLGLCFLADPGLVSAFRVSSIVVLMYALLLFEGLLHCAVQINGADPQGLTEQISASFDRRSRPRVAFMVGIFTDGFEDFVAGRSICAMVCVVTIAFAIEGMPIPEFGPPFLQRFDPQVLPLLIAAFRSFPVAFLLSTLLPCWIGQMLPQLMADHRSIEFLQLPFCSSAVRIAALVGRLGFGWPSGWLLSMVRISGGFRGVERFRIGDKAVFERLEEVFGFCVTKRTVELGLFLSHRTITDTSAMSFRAGAPGNIRHSVRLVEPTAGTLGFLGWSFIFPTGLGHDAPRTQTLLLNARSLETTEAEPDLTNELVFSFEATLEERFPQADPSDGEISISLKLKQDRNAPSETGTEHFHIYMDKPTKVLEIMITTHDDLFVASTPSIRYEIVDAVSFIGGASRLKSLPSSNERRCPNVSTISVPYPPLNARCLLTLDVRLAV